jgi:Bacterial PH domain
MKKYTASLDRMAEIATAITFMGILVSAWIQFFPFTIILSFTLFISYLYSPRYYSTTETDFIVKRPIGDVKIARKDILKTESIHSLKWSVRTFGVGGFFGYFGKFYNSTIGSMTWYATKRHDYVLITTSNNKIIVTPDERDDLMKDLKSDLI